ncbi:MAG: DMT family transporter [Alphaproteobacteria bacterium]
MIPARLTARWNALSASLRASLMVLAAMALYAVNAGLIRVLVDRLPVIQGVFLLSAAVLLALTPWLWRRRLSALRTRRLGLHAARGVLLLLSTIGWFMATRFMAIADVTAVSFMTPLFMTVLAALILGETVGPRRIVALVVGFTGALIILRPGLDAFQWPALWVVGHSLSGALALLAVKRLATSERPQVTVIYGNLIVLPAIAVPAIMLWQPPDAVAWAATALLGILGSTAIILQIRAFALADVSFMALFEYARLPFVAIIGLVAFGEWSDRWTWIGAGIIAVSAGYIARREAAAAETRGLDVQSALPPGPPGLPAEAAPVLPLGSPGLPSADAAPPSAATPGAAPAGKGPGG